MRAQTEKTTRAKLYIYIGVEETDLYIDEAHMALDILRFAVFLAVMSSSRSDVVTQFVFPSVRSSPFFSFGVFKVFQVLKGLNGVSRKFEGCLKFKGRFKNVSRKF